jgi:hypothetical protein
MRVINKTKNTILAERAILATNPFTRAKGLLGRRDFKGGEALIIKPGNSIHTFFMRFPIDVLFIDADNKIIGIKVCLKPWRVTAIYWQAKLVIELPSGMIQESLTQKGDEISLA